MDYSRFSCRDRIQSTFLENAQHRDVFRQDLGDQFFEPGIPGNRGKMPHQRGADPLSLILVDQGESYLRSSWPNDNVTTTTYDVGSFAFFCDDDQGYMVDEVDVREELHFLFGKIASYRKETAAEGLSAGAADGFFKAFPILVPERADFNAATIAQCLNRRKFDYFRHNQQSLNYSVTRPACDDHNTPPIVPGMVTINLSVALQPCGINA
jgi:hypothetical protein